MNKFLSPRAQRFYSVVCSLVAGIMLSASPVHADFINGGFEDVYNPLPPITYNPINGWTLTGYTFNGSTSTNVPTSLLDINLSPVSSGNPATITGSPGGVSDIINGPTQTLLDYFIFGSMPTPTLFLPANLQQSAIINLRPIHAPLTKSGTGKITGWNAIGKQATSLSQTITINSNDFDPNDHKVHIRFQIAPVMENPNHGPNQQPFVAVQLNNHTTGRDGANPLFFMWNYAGQAGVPWINLTSAGSNPGSNTSYQYTNWQAFDISPGNAYIRAGDVIELIVLASGCSPNGHDGHMYLDVVGTQLPPGLWVAATGPATSTPGQNITYTYTYTNKGTQPVDNVQVVAHMPQNNNKEDTTFVSFTDPTSGTSPGCSGTNPVICGMGTLQPGETGTFTITVHIPSSWPVSSGPVNNGNYPIEGTGVPPLLGPLVQTELVAPADQSNLVVDVSGLPPTGSTTNIYTGTYTCSNIQTQSSMADAPNASCDVSNLPPGVTLQGCTITPSSASWTQPATIGINQTVTCTVSGTPTSSGSYVATVVSNSSNNSNSTDNHKDAMIAITTPPEVIVTPFGDGNENITPDVPAEVNPGSTASFTVTPHNGYLLSRTVGGTCPVGSWVGDTYTTGAVSVNCTVIFSAQAQIPGTIDGNLVHSGDTIPCGRPVLLGPLVNIPGDGPTVYSVTNSTGSVLCNLRTTAGQTFLKINNGPGSCTIVGTKGNITSAPLTLFVQ